MANEEDESKSRDFYKVLGLKKECTAAELRNAYKKLALRWHPDRFAASGIKEEEAKQNFQAIQQAYSVLSDQSKRFLYDVGAYDSDDDDDRNGMGDFLDEMAVMMCQTKSNENGEESFEELQELFEQMFQDDINGGSFESTAAASSYNGSSSSSGVNHNSARVEFRGIKADSSSSFSFHPQNFCLGATTNFQERGKKRNTRNRKG